MAMYINVYLPKPLDSSHIPSITRRLAELGLQYEFTSDFSFRGTGFVPIKIRLTIGPSEYRNQTFDTGFEMELSEFDYAKELNEVKNPPRQGWLNKLFVGNQQEPPRDFITNKEMDNLLKQCQQDLSIRYRDDVLTPFAFAAVVAELTNGIVWDGESGEYLNAKDALEQISELTEDWSPP
jgi:hypothetical protein